MRLDNIKIIVCITLSAMLFSCGKDKEEVQDPSKAKHQPEVPAYFKLFNRTSGFVGADVAASISLSPQKTLWLFGDTWYGQIRNYKRSHATISASNTIAIQDGTDPETATLEYFFGNDNGAFFPAPGSNEKLWPMHGCMVNGSLYIFFVQVVADNSALGFSLTNSRMIRITNPLDPPAQWHSTQYTVPHASFNNGGQMIFGSSVLKKDNYLYIYGSSLVTGIYDRYLVLARVNKDSLADFDAWKFYGSGGWHSDMHQAEHLAGTQGFECSISFQPVIGKYVLITTELGSSEKINMHIADEPWGNWSAPVTVYRCPEVGWGANIFCYAAKGHPELSANNELLVTYVSNSSKLTDVVDDAELYWPRFIKVKF